MPPLLAIKDLHKHYPGVHAVNGVNFEVPTGTCFGLLGPNGAGKTTTLEILEGITNPDAGEVRFNGQLRAADYRQRIGIQFQSTALQDFQTVHEVLRLFARFYRHTRPLNELVSLCDLDELLDRDTRKLSGGQRQRLLLAIALVNDPELIFLDEPTTGLDPQSRRNFWALIKDIKSAGKTVLLTTHYMEEASILCDRIAIMDHGKIIEQGEPRWLLEKHFSRALLRLPASAFSETDSLPDEFTQQGDQITLATDDIQQSLMHLTSSNAALDQLHIDTPTLDDLFLKLTGHGLRES